MILAQCHYRQKMLFFPISWREEDQVSNTRLTSFAMSLLRMCGRYLAGPKKVCGKRNAHKTGGKIQLSGGGVQCLRALPCNPSEGGFPLESGIYR